MMISPMFYTLTPNCYKVQFSYHPMMVKCIKRIPSAKYQAEGKFWEVGKQDIEYLQKMGVWARQYHYVSNVLWLEDKEAVIQYEPLPMPTLQVPHNMLVEPYEYQREGIAYALEKKRCIMGDEMGLGKTVQAIGVVAATQAYPALVICPASLKVNWQREFKKFAGVNAVILSDDNKQT